MKKYLFLILILLMGSPVFAVSPSSRVCDSDGDCLAINADGSIPTTGGGGSGTMTTTKEDDVQVGGADIVTLDFGAGFNLTESPDTEINVSLDSTMIAGAGLTGGGVIDADRTFNVVSGDSTIIVSADSVRANIKQFAKDGESSTTSNASGLEQIGGFTLLQGCSDGQILAWVESTDTWDCTASGSSPWTLSTDDLYPTDTADNVGIGFTGTIPDKWCIDDGTASL